MRTWVQPEILLRAATSASTRSFLNKAARRLAGWGPFTTGACWSIAMCAAITRVLDLLETEAGHGADEGGAQLSSVPQDICLAAYQAFLKVSKISGLIRPHKA